MDRKELNKALTNFSKVVVKEARKNLTNQKKGGGELHKSLGYDLRVHPKSFSLDMVMAEYGAFVDKGVKGKDPSKVSKNAKIRGQQAPNSEFRFGSGKMGGYNKWISQLEAWAKKKNIRFRDESGKFKKGSYKTMAHVIAGNIYNRGLKPSLFFTKPFEKHFGKLPSDVVKAYGLDVENFMKQTTRDNKK